MKIGKVSPPIFLKGLLSKIHLENSIQCPQDIQRYVEAQVQIFLLVRFSPDSLFVFTFFHIQFKWLQNTLLGYAINDNSSVY